MSKRPLASTHRSRREQLIVNAAADEALVALRAVALPTPIVRMPWLDDSRRRVWGKLECWQTTGSFKIRGAFNALRKIGRGEVVVTASAGNHGLAVAYAAKELGLKALVYAPLGASETKLLRLRDMNVEVRQFGSDLRDASDAAQAAAGRLGAVYISPFANLDVIVGQATIAVEAIKQTDKPFDFVVTPLGGGGLVFGIASVLHARSPGTQIVAIHPSAFGRQLERTFLAERMQMRVASTIADGLAVQHSDDGWLGEAIGEVVDRFIEVPESNIKGAMLALLHRQSLLVEGAGAIGVAPFLFEQAADQIEGDVLIILSGGNVSSSSLAHAMAAEISDKSVKKKLGLRATYLPAEMPSIHLDAPPKRPVVSLPSVGESAPTRAEFWQEFLSELSGKVSAARRENSRIAELTRSLGCVPQPVEEEALIACANWAQRLIEVESADAEQTIRRVRLALQLIATVQIAHRWSSAASDAVNSSFLSDPTKMGIGQINYDRYGSAALLSAEEEISNVLGLPTDQFVTLLTSSGQAAYATIECFLLREVTNGKLKIATTPYIYFEATEQLLTLPFAKVSVSSNWSLKGLFDFLNSFEWNVFFVDPIANSEGLPTVDIAEFAKIAQKKDWRNRWIVIDGTLLSGGIDPFSVFNYEGAPTVIYYESASKYLQFGLDLQMAGLIVADKQTAQRLTYYRRNIGALMYPLGAARFPIRSRAHFITRMLILTRNCEELVQTARNADKRDQLIIGFPSNWRELNWSHGGGLVTIRFRREGLNNRIALERFIEKLMRRCEQIDISLAKGVSFGFSTTRVSAAAAMAGTADPFLRFSMGDHDPDENERLCNVVVVTLLDFCKETDT